MAQKHLLFYDVNILNRESLIKTKSWKGTEKFKNFKNFETNLEEVIHCFFYYPKSKFFLLLLRSSSFTCIVTVFDLFPSALLLTYLLFSYS